MLPGGASGLPASIIWELGWRWKLLVSGSTNDGAAAVWKFWQPAPVVGPLENVIVQAADDAFVLMAFPTIDESSVRSVPVRSMSVPLPNKVTFVAVTSAN